MKMGSGMFWGIVLIIIGLSLVIKIVFNVEFPIMKILFAFFFIYLGVRILAGDWFHPFKTKKTDTEVIFGESQFNTIDSGKEYNVIFSKGTFDLRNIQLSPTGVTQAKLNTVFGNTEMLIDKNTPFQLTVNSVFAGTKLPNGNSTVFGTSTFSSDSLDTSKPYLIIRAEVVFGGLCIKTL